MTLRGVRPADRRRADGAVRSAMEVVALVAMLVAGLLLRGSRSVDVGAVAQVLGERVALLTRRGAEQRVHHRRVALLAGTEKAVCHFLTFLSVESAIPIIVSGGQTAPRTVKLICMYIVLRCTQQSCISQP